MVNARGSLAQLLQQIADLVTSGEDSGSQHSDGSVPVRLRSVVLALLDQVVAPGATGGPGCYARGELLLAAGPCISMLPGIALHRGVLRTACPAAATRRAPLQCVRATSAPSCAS